MIIVEAYVSNELNKGCLLMMLVISLYLQLFLLSTRDSQVSSPKAYCKIQNISLRYLAQHHTKKVCTLFLDPFK